MAELNETLKCIEHEAPYLIVTITVKKGKKKFLSEFTLICPFDQKKEKILIELSVDDLKKINFTLADKIFRCEKCFREAEIQETVKEKKISIYLSCPQHGRLITREISPEVYDGIRNAWDMKDVKKEEEKIY